MSPQGANITGYPSGQEMMQINHSQLGNFPVATASVLTGDGEVDYLGIKGKMESPSVIKFNNGVTWTKQ